MIYNVVKFSPYLFIKNLLRLNHCKTGGQFTKQKTLHRAISLNDNQIHYLSTLGNISNLEEILDRILIPRVVSSKNHAQVRNYIVEFMKNLGWTIDLDEFDDKTPNFGVLTFTNIITTLNPNAKRFLVLACHYDSKYTREGDFVGATDSAVPCAMLLNLANQMQDILNTGQDDLSLKFIFFDGEEAFKQWGPKDSIYGARHLARVMDKSMRSFDGEIVNDLERIDLLVLLDLLGTPDPKFYNYFSDTERWYAMLAGIEEKLSDMSQLRQYSKGRSQQVYFAKVSISSYIEDDHIPFLKKGVPILHIIPSPFPSVWHTPDDNKSAIDMHTVENLNKIFRVFVAQYLHLQVPVNTKSTLDSQNQCKGLKNCNVNLNRKEIDEL